MLELNQIYCGDNITLCKQLDDECIELTVTSPPYDNLRTYNGFSWSFESLAKELYDATDSLFFDYPVIMRSFAYFAGFSNSDAVYFLKYFASTFGETLYQWQRNKFKNTNNFFTVDAFPAQYEKYKKNYSKFGYQMSLWDRIGGASFDVLSEYAMSYVYIVAKITKS